MIVMVVKIFTLPDCPKCNILKNKMRSLGVSFEESSMEDPETKTDLLMNEIYTNVAPVLFIDDRYYMHDQIFDKRDDNNISRAIIEKIKSISKT
jgi:glutaredoxin